MPPVDLSAFTPEQKKAFNYANTLGTGVSTVDTTTPKIPPTINSSVLTPTPTPNFQTPPPAPIYNVSGLSSELAPTAQETAGSDITKRLQTLNEGLLGQSAYRATKEAEAGLPEKLQAERDLSSRLKALQNEALAIPIQLQQDATGRGITAGGLRPIETAALRNNAIQALGVSSLLEASRGNITLAQDLVERAVAQKFDPIKEEIAVNKANLDLILNDPLTSLADKNRANRQKEIQDAKARAVAIQADNEKAVLAWQAEAIKNHPEAAYQIQQAKGKTPQEALLLLGQYLNDPAKARKDLDEHLIAQAQIDKYRAETAKTNAEAQEKSGSAGITKETYNERSDTINLINTVLANPQLNNVVGLRKLNPAVYVPGAPTQSVQAQVKQLLAKLALDNRSKLKGSGAISDFESRTLNNAASSFSTNQSYEDAQRALKQVRGALTTSNGGTAIVKVTKDGETITAEAGTDAINKMISDGLQVEYQ